MTEFSETQLKQIIREAVREELADAGLRLHDEDHQDEARADFLFLRRLRGAYHNLANKIGTTILLTLLAGLMGLVWIGFQSATKVPGP